MGKRLFQVLGPVLLVGILVLVVLFSPGNFGLKHVGAGTEKRAAVSLSANVLKGEHIKQAAFRGNYVPFMGSSEWSRFEPTHPAVLAQKYHRNYRPFLLGARGTQSLTQFLVMQNLQGTLKNGRAVFVISPQWFVKDGMRPDAFAFYYSQLQTVEWLLKDRHSAMDRYAAQRLLHLPGAQSDQLLKAALHRTATGRTLTAHQLFYLKLKRQLLTREDQFFSSVNLPSFNSAHVAQQAALLPRHESYQALDRLSVRLGREQTSNNRFEIRNQFYNQGLKKPVQQGKLRGFQRDLDYTRSPEFADFQLVLDQFARLHTNVLFVIPPVNAKWARYTGLSTTMLKQFDRKIRYQLQSQGFTHVCDLSRQGNVPYFMADTIHLGWRGWLAMDQRVKPFLTQPQARPHYQLNDQFYTQAWQQLPPNRLTQYATQR